MSSIRIVARKTAGGILPAMLFPSPASFPAKSDFPDLPVLGVVMEKRKESGFPVFAEVVGKSPAAAAGVQADDLILQIDSRKVKTVRDVQSVLRAFCNPGDTAESMLKRRQKEMKLKIKIGKTE